jgi:hypothetical protein
MENTKIKHLEFIQNIIARFNTNSFFIKGWTVTLISALFALSSKDANQKYIVVSLIGIISFWILDGFFISKERQFRALYNKVAQTEEVDFMMNISEFEKDNMTWICGVFSKTLIPFYGILTLIILILKCFI